MKGKCMTVLLAVLLAVGLGTASAAPTAPAVSTTIVISEFRTRGPSGATDEFIELFNISNSPVNIGGWVVMRSNSSGTTNLQAAAPTNTVLNPGCRLLLTCTQSPGYSGPVTGDLTYSTAIADNGGIALCTAAGCATIVDQVGMSSGSTYKEGTTLVPLSENVNQSYERKQPLGTAPYNGQDTDNNATDFFLNSSSSNPQNMSSTCTPLAVTLAAFTAAATPAGVTLAWETVSETDNAGFNVYRAASEAGPWKRLNAALIPAAAPGSSEGHAYTWLDATAAPGVAYAYRLEDVAFDGATTRHAPVQVAAAAEPNAVGLAAFGATATGPSLAGLAALALALAVLAGAGTRRRRRI